MSLQPLESKEEKIISRNTQKRKKTDMDNKTNLMTLYKTQWRAYFKRGLGSPTIVYGESEDIAKRNALAYYRKNCALMSDWPIEKVVDRVDIIG